jgi:hypothetical protein
VQPPSERTPLPPPLHGQVLAYIFPTRFGRSIQYFLYCRVPQAGRLPRAQSSAVRQSRVPVVPMGCSLEVLRLHNARLYI